MTGNRTQGSKRKRLKFIPKFYASDQIGQIRESSLFPDLRFSVSTYPDDDDYY